MSYTTENPTNTQTPDPWSAYGYAEWQNSAEAIRWKWMRMMGMDDQEIEEHCKHDPPTDIDEELRQYNALFGIQG